MRQNSLLIGLIVCIMVFLIGCQSHDKAPSTNTDIDTTASTGITKVSISEAKGFGFINPEFFAEYEDEETLELFRGMISSAIKQQGIVDMIEPEYDLEVVYQDGDKQGYHLWLGDSGQKSTIMNVDNTHTIYTVPAAITDKLINVIKQ